MPKPDPWNDDTIQFPRLIEALGRAGLSKAQAEILRDELDLAPDMVTELFTRATAEWERLKGEQEPPPRSMAEMLAQTVMVMAEHQVEARKVRDAALELGRQLGRDSVLHALAIRSHDACPECGQSNGHLESCLIGQRFREIFVAGAKDERQAILDALDRMHTTDGYPSAAWCQWFADRVRGGSSDTSRPDPTPPSSVLDAALTRCRQIRHHLDRYISIPGKFSDAAQAEITAIANLESELFWILKEGTIEDGGGSGAQKASEDRAAGPAEEPTKDREAT